MEIILFLFPWNCYLPLAIRRLELPVTFLLKDCHVTGFTLPGNLHYNTGIFERQQ